MIEYSPLGIKSEKKEKSHVISQKIQIKRKELETYPFSTRVKYLYTFQEVAFLIFKLSKMLKTRSRLMPKRYEVEVETKEERKLSSMKVNRSKRETWFDLDGIVNILALHILQKYFRVNYTNWEGSKDQWNKLIIH